MTRRRRFAVVAVGVAISLGAVLPTGRALRYATLPAAAAPAVAPGRVTARISLPSTRLAARSTVTGHLVLTNSGERPVDLSRGCTPKWAVVLGRGGRPPDVFFTEDCGQAKLVVKPGTTRLPFELVVGRRAPGRYRAFLVSRDPGFPTAPPVRVTVVSRK